jgi:hypothetical protein
MSTFYRALRPRPARARVHCAPDYEAMVSDQEATTRALLAYLNPNNVRRPRASHSARLSAVRRRVRSRSIYRSMSTPPTSGVIMSHMARSITLRA